jgi:hypothetical protein
MEKRVNGETCILFVISLSFVVPIVPERTRAWVQGRPDDGLIERCRRGRGGGVLLGVAWCCNCIVLDRVCSAGTAGLRESEAKRTRGKNNQTPAKQRDQDQVGQMGSVWMGNLEMHGSPPFAGGRRGKEERKNFLVV